MGRVRIIHRDQGGGVTCGRDASGVIENHHIARGDLLTEIGDRVVELTFGRVLVGGNFELQALQAIRHGMCTCDRPRQRLVSIFLIAYHQRAIVTLLRKGVTREQ